MCWRLGLTPRTDRIGKPGASDRTDRLKANPRWRYREIATSHMAQNEKPFELASMLLELVS